MRWECHRCGKQHEELPERCRRCGTAPEVVLNLWRCAHCGQDEISGTETICPGCGAAKGLGVAMRVAVDERLDGPRALALARGSWLYCAYCDVQVPPVDAEGKPQEECPTCAGPLSEATKEAASRELSSEEAGQYRAEEAQTRGGGQQAADAADGAAKAAATTPAGRRRSGRGLAIGLGLAAVSVVGIYLLFFHGWKHHQTVAGGLWQRTIEIEKFGPVSEEAWQQQLPAGARDLSCHSKVHHHNKVADGVETYTAREAAGSECARHSYETRGGVSVKKCASWRTKYKTVTKTRTRYRQVPVYGQHCRYTVDKWHRTRELVLKGQSGRPPKWPALDGLESGKERPGKRGERYAIILRDSKGKIMNHELAGESEWARYPVETKVIAEVSSGGQIKSLQPAR